MIPVDGEKEVCPEGECVEAAQGEETCEAGTCKAAAGEQQIAEDAQACEAISDEQNDVPPMDDAA